MCAVDVQSQPNDNQADCYVHRIEFFNALHRRLPVNSQPIEDDDVDVARERRRVLRGDAINDMLKIENLTKVKLQPLIL